MNDEFSDHDRNGVSVLASENKLVTLKKECKQLFADAERIRVDRNWEWMLDVIEKRCPPEVFKVMERLRVIKRLIEEIDS